MSDDNNVCPVPPSEFRRGFLVITLWPVPLFPESPQHIQQKNNAQAIEHKKDRHGYRTPFRRGRGTSLWFWHPIMVLPVDFPRSASRGSSVSRTFVPICRHVMVCAK